MRGTGCVVGITSEASLASCVAQLKAHADGRKPRAQAIHRGIDIQGIYVKGIYIRGKE